MTKQKNNEEVTSLRVTKKTHEKFWKHQEYYKDTADDILNRLMFNYKKKGGGKKADYESKL